MRQQQRMRFMAAGLLAGLMLGGCGGDDSDGQAAAGRAGTPDKTAVEAAPATANVKPEASAEANLAVAVADAKTSGPIDLLYDLPAKPEAGQPFTLELTVKPRVPGDTLDVEIGDSPGIGIEGERQSRFRDPAAGEPYKFAVQARGDAEGLYYVTVTARLSNQVQSQGREWAVPVVIVNPPADTTS